MQQAQQMELVKQTAALANTPVFDPEKNPDALQQIYGQSNPNQAPEVEAATAPPGFPA
jgi:hypothetical protein